MRRRFTHEGKRRTVYRGGDGPPVIVIHEIPGITPEVADFGRRVIGAGMTAYLPSLFGTPGRPLSGRYLAQSMARLCLA